jgi:multidrug efflux pump subunit AcrA (membrane-fusion protein)
MPRLLLLLALAASAHAAAPPGLLEVEVARPIFRTVMRQRTYQARIEPRETARVRARVGGPITRAAFNEGDMVKKGGVLFEIDSRLAKIKLAKAEAMLRLATARLKEAKGDEEAQAEADAARADVGAARLAVESATVRSPMDDRVRECFADVGTVVRADDTVLAVIVSTGPVMAVFEVPEEDYLRNFRLALSGKAPAGKEAAKVLVRVVGEKATRAGRVIAVGGELRGRPTSPASSYVERVARVKAEVPDPDGSLVPGMRVEVTANTSAPLRVAYVPGNWDRGDWVQAAAGDGRLGWRQVASVTDAPRLNEEGPSWAVTGLAGGERVVVEGGQTVVWRRVRWSRTGDGKEEETFQKEAPSEPRTIVLWPAGHPLPGPVKLVPKD